MVFLPGDASGLAARVERVAVASGLEQLLLVAARAAWQRVVMQSARLEEEPLALVDWLGELASLPLEFLPMRVTPKAQQAREPRAFSAEVVSK